MTERNGASWLVYALGALCAGAIVAAVLVVGPASGSQATVTRTATVAQGVVQSTVSGSGNLQALSQLNLGFKTSGTVTHIYVAQGQHVTQGQLLASLDPQSAEVTLEQAKAGLQSAEASLAKEEETDGEGSSGSGGATGGATAAAASVRDRGPSRSIDAAYEAPTRTAPATTTPTSTTPTSATPASTTPVAATPTATTPAGTTRTSTTPVTTTPATKSPTANTRTTTTTSTPTRTTGTSKRESEAGSSSSSTKATISTATREANIASARAAVKSDKLTVQSDEEAVQDTNLYAPGSGTIVSLSGQVGEVVSGSGTTRAASSSGSSGGSGASATGGATGASSRSASAASSSSSAASSSSSSSAFAVLSDLSTMQLVVALSESEIGSVRAGQIATVTVEALNGSKLAAHVSEVALLSTSSSGAVSYDVTFQLDQMTAGLRLGMSATGEIVVKQAEGINVPTSAITADTVTVERGGKQLRQRVVTGLAGNTSTIVLSGLKTGETVVLPAASATGSSATNVVSRIGSRLGGGGLGGGGIGGGGLGGGGGAFFRGGG